MPVAAAHQGRVLLIDDDPLVCGSFRQVLERRGHVVFEALDGQSGLERAAQDNPDVILLDLNLPVLGGMDTLKQLAQRCPDVPVIIVSGTGAMNDAINALKLGAADYLMKPLPQTSLLVHTVETHLERSRLIRQNKRIRQELELQHLQIRQDEEAGRRIQAQLFPPQDWSVGSYRFRHCVIPSLLLSGDFVDYFPVDERYVVFYCADISGHGVSSALVTVLVKSLIRKYRERFDERRDDLILDPDRTLTQLNKELLQEELGKHLTVFYGVLDLRSNTLRLSSGGHYPPPVLFSSDGVRVLNQKGMAVGLFPFATFTTETLMLPDVFRLLVFSDGALDALPMPEPEARIAYLRSLSTRQALQRFVAESGASPHLPDDFTVLSISRGEMP